MSQSHAPWLDAAWSEFGTQAIPGPRTSVQVQSYYVAAGHPDVSGDDVAWCAAFVGACLERSGIRCSRSLAARSYLEFGTPIDTASYGAIAVFSRGSDTALGHVAFVVGEASGGLVVLGGNQSNAVGVLTMPRERLLSLRWPSLSPVRQPSAPEPSLATTDEAVFQYALAHVLRMEGGFSDDPYDPGGPTNLGITLADLAAFRGIAVTTDTEQDLRSDVAALTVVAVTPIYRQRYWTKSCAPTLPAALALFHFDTAVNHGVVTAARTLQIALGVSADGEIGPVTQAAARTCDPQPTLERYAELRRQRYRALPTFWRFGRGWLARVDATLSAAMQLATTSNNPQPSEDPSMTTASQSPVSTASVEPKWWGQSLTIWGTIVTGLATVLPIAGPLLGIEISADLVHQLGDGVVRAAQALAGVAGILMTIYGRTRAMQPLVRRDFLVKL